MNTCNSRVLLKTNDRETTLFVTDMTKANVAVPKLIKWDEVELPTAWKLERATPTLPRKAPEFQEIRQSEAGKVEIIFDRRNSFSSRTEATRSEYTSARRSFSVASQSSTNTIPRIIIPNTNLRGIETNSTIPRAVYQTNEEDDQKSIQSPTYSSLNDILSSRKPHLEHNEVDWSDFLGHINRLAIQKFFINIKIIVEDFVLETIALFDTGADSNCILEGLIPTKYFEKTSKKLSTANGSKLQIRYKLSKATIENQGQQIETSFLLVKDLRNEVILGTPFITALFPLEITDEGITSRKDSLDRYKTAFTVPFGQYEWNVTPFGLKNAPSEFQKIMNDIFNPYTSFAIVYIDGLNFFPIY
uniref:Enzymatic polyprotein n=1 Tax=Cajanus cajan TaxID=3821 RepID=A0A151SZY4_CAJCA|nr:Enzymatic polyprotein [Cajanus cajan]